MSTYLPEELAAEILRRFWFRVDTGFAPGDLVVVVYDETIVAGPDGVLRDAGPFVSVETRARVEAIVAENPGDAAFPAERQRVERVAAMLVRREPGAVPLVWCESIGGRDLVVHTAMVAIAREAVTEWSAR